MNFRVILASLAISSARVMYNPMAKGTESVFHLINSASDPAPAWNVNSANAGFLTPRDVITNANPIVYALSHAGRVAAAPPGVSKGPPAIVSHANGAKTPADTPEVQAAKASHNMKVQAAKSAFRQAGGNLIPTGDAAPLAPVVYAKGLGAGVSQGPPAIVSHENGAITPADTPAVQAAKASHNMKVQAAKSAFRQAGGNLIPTGDAAPLAPVVYA